jgi:hypothetical protein
MQGIVWDDEAPRGIAWDDEKPAQPKSGLRKTLDYIAGSVNGPLEAGAQMLSGAAAMPIAGVAGGVRAMFPGPEGVGAETVKDVSEALTYNPVTKAGRDVSAAVALPFEKANEGLGYVGGKVGGILGNEAAGQVIGENLLPAAMTVLPAPKILRSARAAGERAAAAKQLALETGARKNAAALDALTAAEQEGIATNPATTNPTLLNRTRQALAGKKETDAAIAKHNEELWTPIIKRELGVHTDAPLDMTTLRAVREAAAAPNAEIGKLGTFYADDNTIANIRGLSEPVSPFGAETATHSTNSLVDRVATSLGEGRDASQLLKDISVLRNDAQLVFTNKTASPEAVAGARARLRIANELEGMVDANLTRMHEANPYANLDTLLNRYREGRARMAKSYAAERVLDLNTGKIDPLAIAKTTAEDNALTGGFANIGKVAGVMPEVVSPATQDMVGLVKQHFYRSRPGAIIGGGIGTALSGPVGSIYGGMLGATASDILGGMMAKRAASPTSQALRRPKGVTEEMWRPYAELPPSERLTDRPNAGPSPVERMPAEPGTEVVPYNRPNWRMYRGGEPPPIVSGPAQLPEFSAEQVMDVVGKQRAWDYGSEAIKDAAAEAAAYADALRNRVPAKGGIVIGEQSPKGAELPKASALDRAVEKLAAGRAFDLTAEERIAWNKASGGIHAP